MDPPGCKGGCETGRCHWCAAAGIMLGEKRGWRLRVRNLHNLHTDVYGGGGGGGGGDGGDDAEEQPWRTDNSHHRRRPSGSTLSTGRRRRARANARGELVPCPHQSAGERTGQRIYGSPSYVLRLTVSTRPAVAAQLDRRTPTIPRWRSLLALKKLRIDVYDTLVPFPAVATDRSRRRRSRSIGTARIHAAGRRHVRSGPYR